MVDPARTRVCGSKVRTGCSTCKARRLKCDEQKPQCHRCVKANRLCEYGPPMPRKVQGQFGFINYAGPMQSKPLPRPDLDSRQQRALTYFRHRAALELGAPFSLDLWNKHFLLLSEHEPCVRSALIALGSVHEDFTGAENPTVSNYTLSHYGKAIQGVVDLSTSGHPHAVEAALVTCILFACLENMRGFYQSCFSHLASGLNVLQEHQARTDTSYQSAIPLAQLRSLFVRMDSQLMEVGGVQFGNTIRLYDEATVGTPEDFRTLQDAMLYLEMIYNRMQWFHQNCEQVIVDYGTSDDVLAPLYAKRQHLRSEHHRWQLAFDRMMAQGDIGHTCTDHEAGILALRLLSNAVSIMLALDINDAQLEFDLYTPAFQTIVADSEAFIALTSTTTPKSSPPSSVPTYEASPHATVHPPSPTPQPSTTFPTFTMTSGCVFPLYFTAARCRHSPTRHRALKLLQHCHRREGLWDSTLAARIAERLIALEEASTHQPTPPTAALANNNNNNEDDDKCSSSGNLPEVPVPTPEPVPDTARVRAVSVQWTDAQGGTAAFSMQPLGFAVPGERYAGMQFTELVQW